MIEVKIEGHDLRELNRDLSALKPSKLLKDDLNQLGRGIVQEARRYPPSRTSYKRTGLLGRSWMYAVRGLDVHIENPAKYAGYVMGEEQIALHRKHGWRRIFDIATTETEKMLKNISREIDKIWKN